MPDVGFTELVADRIVLRRFLPGDAAAFAGYRSDPAVARYQTWDAPFPRALAARFLGEMMSRHPDTPGQWFQFAVALRQDGSELIGDCGSSTDADEPRHAEIGFTIAPAHQGRGYATEATRTLLGYLFGQRGKHRVSACCDPRNAASAAVLERIGMRREGHLRESTWAKGEWTDDWVYAILAADWLSREPVVR